MFVGLRPAVNVSSANPNQYRDWHRLTLLTDNVIDVTAKSHSTALIDDTQILGANAKTKTSYSQETVEKVTFPVHTETVDTLQLQAHGINIFSTFKAQFFRDYMTYTFGGANIVTPEDPGAMMLNFCLYPGTYFGKLELAKLPLVSNRRLHARVITCVDKTACAIPCA